MTVKGTKTQLQPVAVMAVVFCSSISRAAALPPAHVSTLRIPNIIDRPTSNIYHKFICRISFARPIKIASSSKLQYVLEDLGHEEVEVRDL